MFARPGAVPFVFIKLGQQYTLVSAKGLAGIGLLKRSQQFDTLPRLQNLKQGLQTAILGRGQGAARVVVKQLHGLAQAGSLPGEHQAQG